MTTARYHTLSFKYLIKYSRAVWIFSLTKKSYDTHCVTGVGVLQKKTSLHSLFLNTMCSIFKLTFPQLLRYHFARSVLTFLNEQFAILGQNFQVIHRRSSKLLLHDLWLSLRMSELKNNYWSFWNHCDKSKFMEAIWTKKCFNFLV